MISIATRLESISKSWPHPIKVELNRYIKRFYRKSTCSGQPGRKVQNQPYWFQLPVWLAGKYNREKVKAVSSNVLDDILWAQYCVFLSLRIKDDLFDGQGIASQLFFAADHFLAESNDILHRYLRDSKQFWSVYNGSIRASVLAFWEVDAMQRRRRVSFKGMRAGHARVSSIFKIGAAAVCHVANRPRDYTAAEKAADELAMAGQIIDDFQDMSEDMEQGKLNYAARFIMGYSNQSRPEFPKAAELIAIRLLHSDRVARLFDEIVSHVRAAERALKPLNLANTDQYFNDYLMSLKAITDALEGERIRHLSKADSN